MPLLRVSHRQQQDQADCLVACAAMVLHYLQVPCRYGRLRTILRSEPHGTVFSHLHDLEQLGVAVTIAAGSVDILRTHLADGLPPIVAVDTGELRSYWFEATGHAVVVIGIESDGVHINDPEFGAAPQVVALEEFELAWQEQDFRFAVIRPLAP